jgi:hypothetical protein
MTKGAPAPYNEGMKPALIALLVAIGAVGSSCGGSSVKGEPGPPSADPLLAAAQVQVVAYPDGNVRICPPYVDGGVVGPPAAPNCHGGLRATGVRVASLGNHLKGVSWGYVHLVGVYRDGTFAVTSQRPYQTAPNPPSPFDGPIPCRAPVGGWRLVVAPEAQRKTIEEYQRAHKGDLVSVSFFRDDTILVVASSHPVRTRALLGPSWPRQLCVVRARYSLPFVNRVRAKVLSLMRPMSRSAHYGWVTGAGGYGVNDLGQTTISLEILIETPQLRTFLRRLPRGMVALDSTFQPVPRL